MDAKKRQRCLGALARRKADMLHWEKLEASMQSDGDQKAGFTAKKEKAAIEVAILQSRLGVS